MSGSRRVVAGLVLSVAILQALWIAVVPPFRASDEFDHAYRAAGVAGGQWRATQSVADGRGLLVAVPPDLVRAAHGQCASLPYTGPADCSPVRRLADGRVLVSSGAANYNPAFYWVIGTAARPFDGEASLYAMRITGALLCLAFIGLGAWAFTRRRGGWAVPGFAFALSPVFLFTTGVAAPNGIEMAAGLAFWCALLALDDADPPTTARLLVLATVAGCVLATTRMLGPLFVGTIALTAWAAAPAAARRLWDRHRRALMTAVALVTAAVAASAWWILSTGAVHPAAEKQAGTFTAARLVLWPLQAIAAFPYRDNPGSFIVYPVVLVVFLALVAAALRCGSRRDRFALVGTLVMSLAIPLAITAATYGGRGAMWQGRYGLPYSVGTVLVAAWVLDRRLRATARVFPAVVAAAVLLWIASSACLVKVLWSELGRSVSADDPAWHAPSAVTVWLACGLAFGLQAYASREAARGAA